MRLQRQLIALLPRFALSEKSLLQVFQPIVAVFSNNTTFKKYSMFFVYSKCSHLTSASSRSVTRCGCSCRCRMWKWRATLSHSVALSSPSPVSVRPTSTASCSDRAWSKLSVEVIRSASIATKPPSGSTLPVVSGFSFRECVCSSCCRFQSGGVPAEPWFVGVHFTTGDRPLYRDTRRAEVERKQVGASRRSEQRRSEGGLK